MDKSRGYKSQLPSQIYLLWRREQKVASTHNLVDAHQRIVHYDCKLISPRSVLAAHDEVAALCGEVDGVRAVMSVAERYQALAFVGYLHANGSRTGMNTRRQIAACAFIHYPTVALVRCLRGHDVGSCAIARIGQPALAQLLETALVYRATLTLPVWTLVPVESEPVKVVHYQFGILAVRALRVDILYAQQPCAALRLGRKPRQQSAEHVAQVHASRWRRSETALHLRLQSFCIISIFNHPTNLFK